MPFTWVRMYDCQKPEISADSATLVATRVISTQAKVPCVCSSRGQHHTRGVFDCVVARSQPADFPYDVNQLALFTGKSNVCFLNEF